MRHWRQERKDVAEDSGRMVRFGILGAAQIAEKALMSLEAPIMRVAGFDRF